MLIHVKSFEILPKHKGYFFILKSFAFNWYIILALTNEKLLRPYCRLKAKLGLTKDFTSTINVVSSNPCFGPSPKMKTSFLTCSDELVSAPKAMTFLAYLPSENKNSE